MVDRHMSLDSLEDIERAIQMMDQNVHLINDPALFDRLENVDNATYWVRHGLPKVKEEMAVTAELELERSGLEMKIMSQKATVERLARQRKVAQILEGRRGGNSRQKPVNPVARDNSLVEENGGTTEELDEMEVPHDIPEPVFAAIPAPEVMFITLDQMDDATVTPSRSRRRSIGRSIVKKIWRSISRGRKGGASVNRTMMELDTNIRELHLQ